MKIATDTVKEFTPASMTITFETANELKTLYTILGAACSSTTVQHGASSDRPNMVKLSTQVEGDFKLFKAVEDLVIKHLGGE